MTVNNSYRKRKDLDDPDEDCDPWSFQGSPWLANAYNRLIERRSDRLRAR